MSGFDPDTFATILADALAADEGWGSFSQTAHVRPVVDRILADPRFAASEHPPVDPLREALLVQLAAAIPGQCDWGGCDNNALLARFDAARGWLPVCQWHIDAPSADLAPITAVAFEAEWQRLASPVPRPEGLDVERWLAARHRVLHPQNVYGGDGCACPEEGGDIAGIAAEYARLASGSRQADLSEPTQPEEEPGPVDYTTPLSEVERRLHEAITDRLRAMSGSDGDMRDSDWGEDDTRAAYVAAVPRPEGPYLSLVADWSAVMDHLGLEGDESRDEVIAAIEALAAVPRPEGLRDRLAALIDAMEASGQWSRSDAETDLAPVLGRLASEPTQPAGQTPEVWSPPFYCLLHDGWCESRFLHRFASEPTQPEELTPENTTERERIAYGRGLNKKAIDGSHITGYGYGKAEPE